MKKQLCIILMFSCAIPVFCQQKKSLKFGIQAGAAFANSKQDYANPGSNPSPSTSTKTGVTAGCFLNYTLGKTALLQPAFLYVRKGARYKYQNNSYYNHVLYNYFEIPVDILYKTAAGNGSFCVGGGLSPAFKIRSAIVSNETTNFDLGVNALAMYQWPLGFSANLRYTYGLLNANAVTTNITRITNSYFSITAGYEF